MFNKIARQPNQRTPLFKLMHAHIESQRNSCTTEATEPIKKNGSRKTLPLFWWDSSVDSPSYSATDGLELTVSPSSEPIEEEPVVLRCKADMLLYRNLAWFRLSGTFDSERTPAVQPCYSLSLSQHPLSQAALSGLEGAKLSLELSLASASRRDQGVYVCQVEDIKTRKKICMLRSLTLRGTRSLLLLQFTES